MSVRGWDEVPLSELDRAEQVATHYLLKDGVLALVAAAFRIGLFSPSRMLRALRVLWSLTRDGGVPLVRNLVYLTEACRVAEIAREKQLTHIHAHFGTNPASVAILASVLSGASFSFTVHGPEEFDKPQALKLREKIRAAAFVVAISSFGRSQLYRWCEPELWPKVKVVACGLDERFLATDLDQGGLGKTFVCVGRLCEQKGQLLLLQALANVVREDPEAKLILAGDGSMRPEVEAEIERLQLGDHVSITGWLSNDEVRSVILGADALVLASFAEGLPVVIMEALAVGRPVISTYIAGIPELVRNGAEGLLVPAGDSSALSEAMLSFLRLSASERFAMQSRGRARVSERHNATYEAAKLAEHFAMANRSVV